MINGTDYSLGSGSTVIIDCLLISFRREGGAAPITGFALTSRSCSAFLISTSNQ